MLFSERLLFREMHYQQSLECRPRAAVVRGPSLKLCDDLALSSNALLDFDDEPFSFGQVFPPGGVNV
jgi:hypothetical protein